MWLLARQLPVSGEFVLGAMCRRAFTPTVRLWAIRSPFETKEALRTRAILGQDPARSSSIVLTTVTDVTGFLSFLGIAALLAGIN